MANARRFQTTVSYMAPRTLCPWEFYKSRTTPRKFMTADDVEMSCRRYDRRERPLSIHAGSSYGLVRNLMGVEAASQALYDDPEPVGDVRRFVKGEDLCGKT